MKNKKDKLIVLALLFLLLIGTSGYFLWTNLVNKNNLGSASSTSANVSSQIKDIDWGTYDSNDITLTKSIRITEAGTYTLTGTISDGLISINTDGNVKLILNGVSITNSNGPAIYVENAKTVEVETAKGTTNTLVDGSVYYGYEESVIGTIYSKDDLVLSGNGTLKVTSNKEDAIVSKDDLKITSGTYIINSVDDGIRGKDSLEITDGTFTITAKGDALKSTNNTDTEKGFVLISGGTFNIDASNDGIQGETNVVISGGDFTIKTGGGASNASVKADNGPWGKSATSASTNEESTKGIKAENNIEISGGIFNLDTKDDSIHSNGNITISKGDFTITSADDGIHGDGLVEINGGTFNITAHEGIEGTYIKINDGTISISASDDGINAANKSTNYKTTVEINGGKITIVMGSGDTDGIDSNGNLYINGGTIDITGNSPFDYDGEAKYNGGTIIVNGEKTNTITNQFMGGGQRGNQGTPIGGYQGQNNQGGPRGRR